MGPDQNSRSRVSRQMGLNHYRNRVVGVLGFTGFTDTHPNLLKIGNSLLGQKRHRWEGDKRREEQTEHFEHLKT